MLQTKIRRFGKGLSVSAERIEKNWITLYLLQYLEETLNYCLSFKISKGLMQWKY